MSVVSSRRRMAARAMPLEWGTALPLILSLSLALWAAIGLALR
jgi:hypothetical protein